MQVLNILKVHNQDPEHSRRNSENSIHIEAPRKAAERKGQGKNLLEVRARGSVRVGLVKGLL